jgi:hypothetical protein
MAWDNLAKGAGAAPQAVFAPGLEWIWLIAAFGWLVFCRDLFRDWRSS